MTVDWRIMRWFIRVSLAIPRARVPHATANVRNGRVNESRDLTQVSAHTIAFPKSWSHSSKTLIKFSLHCTNVPSEGSLKVKVPSLVGSVGTLLPPISVFD
jgi:hypothetical protein